MLRSFFLIFIWTQTINAHSFLSCPPPLETDPFRGGNVNAPCEMNGWEWNLDNQGTFLSTTKRKQRQPIPLTHVKAGSRLKIGWPSLNHAGGHVRLSLVSWDEAITLGPSAFDHKVLKYSCFGTTNQSFGECNHPCNARSGCEWQTSFNVTDSQRYDTIITIPTNLPQDLYFLQWKSRMSLSPRIFYSCAMLNITDGNTNLKGCQANTFSPPINPLICDLGSSPEIFKRDSLSLFSIQDSAGPFCFHKTTGNPGTVDDGKSIPINADCDSRLSCSFSKNKTGCLNGLNPPSMNSVWRQWGIPDGYGNVSSVGQLLAEMAAMDSTFQNDTIGNYTGKDLGKDGNIPSLDVVTHTLKSPRIFSGKKLTWTATFVNVIPTSSCGIISTVKTSLDSTIDPTGRGKTAESTTTSSIKSSKKSSSTSSSTSTSSILIAKVITTTTSKNSLTTTTTSKSTTSTTSKSKHSKTRTTTTTKSSKTSKSSSTTSSKTKKTKSSTTSSTSKTKKKTSTTTSTTSSSISSTSTSKIIGVTSLFQSISQKQTTTTTSTSKTTKTSRTTSTKTKKTTKTSTTKTKKSKSVSVSMDGKEKKTSSTTSTSITSLSFSLESNVIYTSTTTTTTTSSSSLSKTKKTSCTTSTKTKKTKSSTTTKTKKSKTTTSTTTSKVMVMLYSNPFEELIPIDQVDYTPFYPDP